MLRLEFAQRNTCSSLNGCAIAQFGTAPPYQSMLRISYYDETDAYYRHPSADTRGQRELPNEESGQLLPQGLPWPALLALAPGLLGIPRRNRVACRVLLLVLVLILGAGCLSTRPSSTNGGSLATGQADVRIHEAEESGLGAQGLGALAGEVHDPQFIPIGAVSAALLGSPHFDRSDGYGRFLMRDIAPGPYRLRLDAPNYHSFETAVTIVANNVTSVKALLIPLDAKTVDVRPHRHDYWDQETRRRVLEVDVTDNKPFYLPHKTNQGPLLVIPGTHVVEVSVSWPGGVGGVGLSVQPNHDPDGNNISMFAPRGNNSVFRIQTNWEMTDVGHQIFSTWAFELNTRNVRPEKWPVRVTIDLVRGALPLEPGHPDHWKGERKMTLTKEAPFNFGTYSSLTMYVQLIGFGSNCYTHGSSLGTREFTENLGAPAKVVPQGAAWVNVSIAFSRANGVSGASEYSWKLWYKGGQEPPTEFSATAGIHKLAPDPVISSDRTKYAWSLRLAPEEADGIYNRKSAWNFVITPTDYNAACADAYAHPNAYLTGAWSGDVARN